VGSEQIRLRRRGQPCPPTVNPSLWRQSQLCAKGGLFKVVERMYQVRNHDISNLTIVEGDTGLILFDPLISTECSKAALELYYEHRPHKPVLAVVYSHSHVDHYGGVKGVIAEEDVAAGKVRVIAPEGFLEAAVSENIMAGNVMTRRALYQYGSLVPFDEKGNLGLGLGTTISLGTITLIAPTETITETGQKLDIDGLTFEFMLAPDTEAPSEMHWFIEELGALTAAENCCHTLHNTYTLRGAQIRDPHAWAQYLGETIERWGAKTEVLYGMHHWPVWGSERAIDLLSKGRDAYAFINDETLRLANHGFGPVEIAEKVKLPDVLDRHWALRGYYGTLNHNVKATYVKYLGWFDGNPAHAAPAAARGQHQGDERRPVLQLHGCAAERREGGRRRDHAELGAHRHQRAGRARPLQRRAEPRHRTHGRRGRRDDHAHASRPQPLHPRSDDARRGGVARGDQRQPGHRAAGYPAGPARRLRSVVQHHRAMIA
jgi:alkyl sulfatase BDS1-like metallo-beta-lactamase superfamily hydrolase